MYFVMWGQAVLLPAYRHKVTTMRPTTPWLFNVQHVPKLLPGKAHPAGQHWVAPLVYNKVKKQTNSFSELNLVDRMPDELWQKVDFIVKEEAKNHSQKASIKKKAK